MIDTAGGSTSADVGEGAIPPSPAPNVVHLRERCPGSPHPFDVVTLRPEVSHRMGIAVAAVTNRARNEIDAEAEMGMVFIRYGIEGWTFEDKGPVPCAEPVDPDLIARWLPWSDGGYEVAEAANNLYADEVFRPFLPRLKILSPPPVAAPTISARTNSGRSHRKPSRRSSLTGSAGKRSPR